MEKLHDILNFLFKLISYTLFNDFFIFYTQDTYACVFAADMYLHIVAYLQINEYMYPIMKKT